MMKLRGATALVVAVVMVAIGAWVSAGEREGRYHEKETIMYGRATVTFAVLNEDGKPQEELNLTSYIKIRMEAPFTNRGGLRQFNFWIEEWEVFGPSETLGGHFIITLSEDVEQPKGYCVALEKEVDFPADVFFNAIYDVYLDDKLVLRRHPGKGVSERATRIPPETPTIIEHPFEIDGWPFTRGACKSTTEISAEEFIEAVAKVRALRGVKLKRG
jgi:hypothetical protein